MLLCVAFMCTVVKEVQGSAKKSRMKGEKRDQEDLLILKRVSYL